ncbi:transcriptional regulator PpsR [soil metagenome]
MNTRNILQPDLSALSEWAPEIAQTFVSLSSDIALVLDDAGVIRSVAQGSAAPLTPTAHEWVGRSWADTVTGETRGKIELLLQEVTSTGLARRREINHPLDKGGNVAVAYTAIRLGENGPLLAVGRDLGAIVAIQQRFLDAQHEMERSYWRARQAEARYRLLFQVATDAVMVIDAQSLEILEANQAASRLFDLSPEQVLGRPASFGFERHSRGAIDELLATARATGQPAEIRARLLGKITATSVAATPFRTEDSMRLLVRVRTMDMPGSSADLNATLARLVDGASDGVVVTDSSGRVMLANPAFLKLVHTNTEVDVKGRPLMDWIGMSDDQFSRLLSQVRREGITRRVESRLMSADASVTQVEVSAALLTEGDQECIGFTIHFVAHTPAIPQGSADVLHSALNRICARVGSTPLPELLLQAQELLERHLIQAALASAKGDTAAAASLLGISRTRLDGATGAGPLAPTSP